MFTVDWKLLWVKKYSLHFLPWVTTWFILLLPPSLFPRETKTWNWVVPLYKVSGYHDPKSGRGWTFMGGRNLCHQSLPSTVLAKNLDIKIERKGENPKTTSKQNTNQKPDTKESQLSLSLMIRYKAWRATSRFHWSSGGCLQSTADHYFSSSGKPEILENKKTADLFKEKCVGAFF